MISKFEENNQGSSEFPIQNQTQLETSTTKIHHLKLDNVQQRKSLYNNEVFIFHLRNQSIAVVAVEFLFRKFGGEEEKERKSSNCKGMPLLPFKL